MDDEKSDVELKLAKRRQAVHRWKENNREYYLEQKRRLAHRPEYLKRRREMYKAKHTSNEKSENSTINSFDLSCGK